MVHDDENVTMHDLGEKMSEGARPSGVEKDTTYYPSMRVSSKQLPKVEDMDVGDKVSMMMEGVIKSKSKDDDSIRCEIEMHKGMIKFKG